MSMLIYNLNEINDIRDNGFIFELSESSLDVINTISEVVGASNYVRTPIFPRKEKRANKSREVVHDPNFKATVLIKEETNTVLIRSLLNKLTDKNYDIIFEEINNIIENIVKDENIEEMNKISDFIFSTAGANKAFSCVYAKMYKQLINKYNIFQDILSDHLKKHVELFKNIDVVDPMVDYEEFCNMNRLNEGRRALSTFISNLYKLDTMNDDIIYNIIEILHSNIEEKILTSDVSGVVLEIAENSSILILTSYEKLYNYEKWNNIYDYIQVMIKRKTKDYNSLPSKSIFKYMDINDKIKKNLDK